MALVDVNIRVPMEMAAYLQSSDQVIELERNALLLYPYILKQTISHGVRLKYWEYAKMN